jgi:hypothetical protein
MKYIIILLAIISIVSGEVCKGKKFENVFTEQMYFTGNFNYDAPFVENWLRFSSSFKITDIQEGRLSFTQSDIKHSYHYWLPRLDCQPRVESDKLVKVCLLQYIIMKDNLFFTTRKQLKYFINDEHTDECINEIRQKLNDNQPTTDSISYIEGSYQLFSIALPDAEKALNFHTKTMKFSWEGENQEIENITISPKEKNELLTINGESYTFSDGSRTTMLLKKIRLLLETCPSIDGEYNYYDLQSFDSTGKLVSNLLPVEGKIDLSSLDDIKIKNAEKKLSLVKYKSAKSLFPVYEKYNLEFTLKDTEKAKHIFFVTIQNKKCLAFIEGCPKEVPQTLYYFKELDVEGNREYKFGEVVKGLEFIPDEGAVKEREGDTKLELTLNKIRLYDFELRQDLNNKEDWLYIKGIDGNGKIINKKYLVKTTNRNLCRERYESLESKLYDKQEEQGKFFLWEDIEGSFETFKPLGLMNVHHGQISLQGEINPRKFDTLELLGSVLRVKNLVDDKPIDFDNLSKKCLQRLKLILSSNKYAVKETKVISHKSISLKPLKTALIIKTKHQKANLKKKQEGILGSEKALTEKKKHKKEQKAKMEDPAKLGMLESVVNIPFTINDRNFRLRRNFK